MAKKMLDPAESRGALIIGLIAGLPGLVPPL